MPAFGSSFAALRKRKSRRSMSEDMNCIACCVSDKGMAVRVVFEPAGPEWKIPKFTPA
jgi:hypothetical protein